MQPPSPQALEEALAAVKEWSETARLPRVLTDCFMWQQEVWTGRLLPAILACCPDTQTLVEERDRLVEALHAKGKVPGSLYSRYREGTLFEKEEIKGDPVDIDKNDNLEKLEIILGDVELLKDCELRKVLDKAKHLVKKLRNKEIGERSFSTSKVNTSVSPH